MIFTLIFKNTFFPLSDLLRWGVFIGIIPGLSVRYIFEFVFVPLLVFRKIGRNFVL